MYFLINFAYYLLISHKANKKIVAPIKTGGENRGKKRIII